MSLGVISATGRDIGSGPYNYLQTDAAINRGHSGGPLFDLDGEVVGMASAIYSPTSGNVGIAFAVPSNLVRDVAQKLKQSGSVERGWFGVKIQNVTEDIAQSLGLEQASGAMISEILKNGPAARAGLAAGDVLVSIDGRTIADSRHLARIVGEYAPDTDIELGVSRKGKSEKVRVKLGKFPALAPTQPETHRTPATGVADFGLSLEPAPGGKKGVVIKDVGAQSEAAQKGLKAGDVIAEVGGEPVTNASDFAFEIAKARRLGRKAVLLNVRSGDQQRFVALTFKAD